MRKYDEYSEHPKGQVKALDRKEQQGWMLWALLSAFFLGCGIMFFSLTI
ncbi:MAG: hypothetical protein GY801_28115 [bacterium]|nr:hypothetical protein [bacterium]